MAAAPVGRTCGVAATSATSARPSRTAKRDCWAATGRGAKVRGSRRDVHSREEQSVNSTEIEIMNYDPLDRLSVTTRAQLLELFIPLARQRDRGELPAEGELSAAHVRSSVQSHPEQQ